MAACCGGRVPAMVRADSCLASQQAHGSRPGAAPPGLLRLARTWRLVSTTSSPPTRCRATYLPSWRRSSAPRPPSLSLSGRSELAACSLRPRPHCWPPPPSGPRMSWSFGSGSPSAWTAVRPRSPPPAPPPARRSREAPNGGGGPIPACSDLRPETTRPRFSHGVSRKPEPGFEPGTCRLQGGCSDQLSYSGRSAHYRRLPARAPRAPAGRRAGRPRRRGPAVRGRTLRPAARPGPPRPRRPRAARRRPRPGGWPRPAR